MRKETPPASSEEALERMRVVLEEASRRVQNNPDFAKRTIANWEKGRRLGT